MPHYLKSPLDLPLCRPVTYRLNATNHEPFFADPELKELFISLWQAKHIEDAGHMSSCQVFDTYVEFTINIFNMRAFMRCKHAVLSRFCVVVNQKLKRTGAVFLCTPVITIGSSVNPEKKEKVIFREDGGKKAAPGKVIEGKFSKS